MRFITILLFHIGQLYNTLTLYSYVPNMHNFMYHMKISLINVHIYNSVACKEYTVG